MSATVNGSITNPDTEHGSNEAIGQGQPGRSIQHKNYKGFVAGVFSGVTKLSGMSLPTEAIPMAKADMYCSRPSI